MDFLKNLDSSENQENNQEQGSEEREAESKSEQLILGKFRTQGDLIKSYQELEKQFTQISQERKQFEEANQQWNEWYQNQYSQIQEQLRQVQERKTGEPEEDFSTRFIEKPREMIQEVLKTELTPLIAPLYQNLIDQQVDIKISDMKSKYPDFVELKDKVADEVERLIKNYPYLQYETKLIEDVYWIVKGKESLKAFPKQLGEKAYGEIPNKKSGVKRSKSEEEMIGDELVELAKQQQGFFKI